MSTNERVRAGAARVALRALWTACIWSPDAFGPTRVRFSGEARDVDEIQAAIRIAATTGALELRADKVGDGLMHVRVTPHADESDARQRGDPMAPRPLEFLLPDDDMPILVLAAGQAYKVSPATAEHLASTLFLSPNVSGGGGPPDDVWASQWKLPAHWLEGCGLVWMLGRHDGTGLSLPVRLGDAWNEQNLTLV